MDSINQRHALKLGESIGITWVQHRGNKVDVKNYSSSSKHLSTALVGVKFFLRVMSNQINTLLNYR